MSRPTSPTFGRAVIMDNDIILAGGSAATGILVAGASNGQYFEQVVIRNNEISADLGSGSTLLLTGIQVFNAKLVNLENNVINDYGTGASDALSVQYCTTVKAFNNLNSVGQLLRVYDLVGARTLLELEDFIEDSILGF